MIDVSIVLPVYMEEENIEPLFAEIAQVFSSLPYKYEIIAVDDGSADNSLAVLQKMVQQYPHVRVVAFRRNYGQASAFTAGFRHVRGEFVVTMDSDRQNNPADIPHMIEKLKQDKSDFISGWRKVRRDNALIRTLPSRIANYIIRKVTGSHLHDLGCSLKVYRREVVADLNLYGEMHRFINILVEDMGYVSTEYVVDHRPRVAGKSKYGIKRIFKVLLDLFLVWFMKSYQTKSIYVYGGAGLYTICASVALAFYVLFQKYSMGVWVHKNPIFILSVILAVIGVQFLGLGLISEIINRTYFESQSKTVYRIKAIFDHNNKQKEAA